MKTTIHRMNDLLDGTWKERHGPGRRQFSLTRDQAGAIEDYCSFCESTGRKPGTIAIRLTVCGTFHQHSPHKGLHTFWHWQINKWTYDSKKKVWGITKTALKHWTFWGRRI